MIETRSFTISLEEWPLVVTTMREGILLEDVHVMNATFDELLARRERFGAVTDARAQRSFPPSSVRAAITRWNRENEDRIRQWNAAGSIVLGSAVARAALRAIHWIAPHPTPYAVCATMDEARAFCAAALAREAVA